MLKRIFLACTLGLVHVAYGATTGIWNLTTGGTWDQNANWTPGPFPNAAGDTANFLDKITANSTITSGIAITVGNITFDNSNNYLVSLSGRTLTMNNGGTAHITVTNGNGSGSHEISAPVSLANALLFTHSSTANFTMSGVISGTGITKTGAGTGALILTGINTYSGLEIDAGTVEVSSNANLGLTVANLDFGGGTLRTTASFTIPVSKPITIAGPSGTFETLPGVTTTVDAFITGNTLIKTGAGTLALTFTFSPLTYFGVKISDGTLAIAADGCLGFTAGGLTFDGGALRTTASFSIPAARAISITGAAAIFEPTSSVITTILGVIPGALKALTKIGAGTLVLANAGNSYSGGTNINAGALSISSDGNLGFGTGGITFDGGTLRTTASFPIPITRAISITSAATFEPNAIGITTTVDGAITGGGSLTKIGAGTLVLTNPGNSYGGGTTINVGTLSLSGAGILLSTGTVSVNSATSIFDISATAAGATIGELAGVSGGSVTLGAKTLTFGGTGTVTFAGSISDTGGNGSIIKQGSGTAIFSGTSTYGSGTIINNGTLRVSGAGFLLPTGAVSVNSPTSIFDLTDLAISVIGDLSGVGGGSVVLATNSFFNFGTASPTTTFAGNISGADVFVIKRGSGNAIFSNVNTYTGITFINNGTLSLSNSGALAPTSGVVVNSAASVFDISALTTLGTTIGDLSSGFATSSVVLGVKSLTFGTAASTTFAGNISGSGTLVKKGSGIFTISGTNAFIGTFNVNAGKLNMASTGSFPFASMTNIAVGTTLTGTGTLGAVTLHGTVSPGNSIGTINVGNITFSSGSKYTVEISDTASDKIASSGVVTINPGAIITLVASGLTSPLSSYLVIDSSLPLVRNGDFTLVNPFTRFQFSIQYTAQDVLVVLSQGTITPFSATGNAAGVARCFNSMLPNLPPDLIPVLNVLNVQTAAEWQDSFNQMQPSNFDDIAYAQENVAERIRQNFSAHLFEQRVQSCPNQLNSWRLWFTPFVEHVHQHGRGEHEGYKENFRGFTAAIDYQFKKYWTLTSGFSWADSDVGIVDGSASGDFKTYAGSVGAICATSHFYVDALLSYLFSPTRAKRKMNFTGPGVAPVSLKAHHHQDSNEAMGHLGAGYNIKIDAGDHGTLHVHPFINVDYIIVMQDGYKESGAQSLNLHVTHKNYDMVRPEGGLGFGYAGCFEKVRVNADVSVSYIREQRMLGKKTKTHFESSSCIFKVKGLSPNNNLVSPTARITVSTANKSPVSFSFGYHGEFGTHFIENAGEAEIKFAF